MAWYEIAEETQYMVALAPQTALNTAGSSWEWIECALIVPEPLSTQVDIARGAESFGAFMPPIPGKRWVRMALKGPVKGQGGSFAFASDTPALKGLSRFLEFLGGQSAIAYQATGIEATGSDANTLVLKTSNAKAGCLLAARDTSGGLVNHGFVKTVAGGGGPWTTELFEDLAAQPADDAGRLATLTCYPKRAALTNVAYTVRQVFTDTTQDRYYQNFVPTSMKLLVEDDVLMWEVMGIALSPETEDNNGGLTSLTSLLAMDSAVAATRYVLGGSNVLGDPYNDGELDPSGSCGVRDVVLNIEWGEPYVARGGGSDGGVCDVQLKAPTITVDLAVPSIGDYNGTGGKNLLLEAYTEKTPVSISAYHGNAAGKLLAWNLPAGHPVGEVRRTFINGVEHYVGTLRGGHWTGDSASTDAGNKVLRIGVG